MSAPAVSPAVAPSTSVRKAADTASATQGAGDAPTDLFQDLMQALSAVADATALPGSGNLSALADDLPAANDTQLSTGPTDSLALSPDYLGLGLVFAQPLPALPPAVPLTLRSTTEGQALPPDGLTATAKAPVAGTFSDLGSPTQALLDMVRGKTPSSLTALPSVATTFAPATPPTPAKPSMAPELAAVNPMVTPEPITSKTTKTNWATLLDTAAAPRSTTEGQALPPDGLTATAKEPVAGTFSDTGSPTQALLDMVRSQTTPSLTTLSPAAMAFAPVTPPTPAKPSTAPELAAVNPMVTPEPAVGKITQPGWATALDTTTANATVKSQDLPLDSASQPVVPATPDALGGIRQTTTNTLDTTSVYRSTLHSPPSSPEFPAELVSELRFLVKGGLQHAELRMNPVELGPVQIELRLNDQVADIGFTAAHAATREGIAQSLPQLRDMLSSQGLSLGHTSVGAEAQGQQQAQQERTRPDTPPHATSQRAASATMAVRVGGAAHHARGVLDLYA